MTITSIQGETPETEPDLASEAEPDFALTERQRRILDCIAEHTARHGYPPSVREVGNRVGLASTSSVHHQLRTLERLGYLRRGSRKSRAVVVRPYTDGAAA